MQASTHTTFGTRRRVVGLAVLVLLVASAWAFWVRVLEPVEEHSAWERRVRAGLRSLEARRPTDLPPDLWEFVSGWTVNLHGNCGSHYTYVSPGWRAGFLAELDR